jgi:hypothetical protein
MSAGNLICLPAALSVVLSQGSHRVIVYRNGIEIGRARLTVTGDAMLTNHVLVLRAGASNQPDPYAPDPAKFHWMRVSVPGHMGEAGSPADPAAVARIRLPAEFVKRLNAILQPGATVFVTDQPLSPETSGAAIQVVDADPPADKRSKR